MTYVSRSVKKVTDNIALTDCTSRDATIGHEQHLNNARTLDFGLNT